jgi:chemotaxis protein CheX
MGSWSRSVNTKSLVLSNILDLKAASPLAESLLSMRGNDLVLDASHVERVGGQCLQVLVSAVSTWHADGVSMDFADPSDAFSDGLAGLGVKLSDLQAASHLATEDERSAA